MKSIYIGRWDIYELRAYHTLDLALDLMRAEKAKQTYLGYVLD